MPKMFSDPEAIAEDIIRDVGTNLVVGLPLGLGKANHIVNALYERAASDRSIKLTFLTALTLEKPKPKNLLRWRFISPVVERLFGGYPDLAYADVLRKGDSCRRILLPSRTMDVCAASTAELHFGELYPHSVVFGGRWDEPRPPAGGQARR